MVGFYGYLGLLYTVFQRTIGIVGHETRRQLNRILVDQEVGTMKVAIGGVGHMDTYTEIACGNFLCKESEVFGRHPHIEPIDILSAKIVHPIIVDLLGAGIVVDHIGITIVDEEIAFASHALSDTAADTTNLLVSLETPLLIEGTDNTLHLDLVGDDIGATVGIELAEAESGWHHRRGIATHHLLKRHHNMGSDEDGIDREMGCSPMSPLAFDGPIELVGRGHIFAFTHSDATTFHLRKAVESIDLVGHTLIEKPIVHHHASSTRIHLLRWLEDKQDATVELILDAVEDFGST